MPLLTRLAATRLASTPVDVRVRQGRKLSASFLEGNSWLAIRFASDAAMLVLGVVTAIVLEPAARGVGLLALYPPLALVLLASRGRYRPKLRDVVIDSVAPGFGALSIAAMSIFVLGSLVFNRRSSTDTLVIFTWLGSLTALTCAGGLLNAIQYLARRRGLVSSPTLIVGTDVDGQEIARRLAEHPEYGLRPVGFVDDGGAVPGSPLLPRLGALRELDRIAGEKSIGHVIVGFPSAPLPDLLALIKRCDELHIATMVLPRLSASINHQTQFEYLGTVPLLNLRATNPDDWRFAIKHLSDRMCAAALVVLLAPVLAAIAMAVRLSSPGPVLFRQLRVGRDDQIFNVLKFRTMVHAVPGECQPWTPPYGVGPGGVEGVDRRTRVGRLLRRTSLDELPQLFNVLRAEMSLVGPRPERPELAERFGHEFDRYHDRQRVRSGITGWAQVHGCRGQTPLRARIELDNFYIEHWSMSFDLKIMLLTLPALLRGS
jgi:exopolysaccharide biosynthesis polyprenyl glycosylphosphotransferase